MGEPDEVIPSFRPRLFTRGAAMRLGVFAGLVSLLGLYGWNKSIRMPGRSYKGPLPALTATDVALRERLRGHVVTLATHIGARSTSVPAGLARAEAYVRGELTRAGYAVTDEVFRADGVTCRNFVVERPGTTRPREVVILGAHYDGVNDKPAANDNASGTAALIELARAFTHIDTARTPGVGWSDHWSYWQVGYPAIMVTDSAPYRDPNYHTLRDTPDKLDFDRMTRVVAGLAPVVRDLATVDRRALTRD